jgi:hypothetical protein
VLELLLFLATLGVSESGPVLIPREQGAPGQQSYLAAGLLATALTLEHHRRAQVVHPIREAAFVNHVTTAYSNTLSQCGAGSPPVGTTLQQTKLSVHRKVSGLRLIARLQASKHNNEGHAGRIDTAEAAGLVAASANKLSSYSDLKRISRSHGLRR